MDTIKFAKSVDRAIRIEFEDGKVLTYEDCWLRDHCRCQTCYHADTFQRAQHILDIPDSRINKLNYSHSKLSITWDDGHISNWNGKFLRKYDYENWTEKNRLKPILWNGGEVAKKIAKIHVDEFINSTVGAKVVMQSLLDYGVALIEGVGVTVGDTEEVCKALGGVQHTIFGGMWRFTTIADHADTAYTNLPLASHNDNTYFTEAAGLQVLHCLEHKNGTGGETTLVDGFYGATKLKAEHPDDFQFLSKFHLEAEYIEEGHHHKYSAPVINMDPSTGDLKQIRFNVYDRSPMAFANSKECRTYYSSLRNLASYFEDPKNQWQFKLTPGLVMVMDNFRVLHGRKAFTGNRVLCGSYVSRSDWLDRARTLELIQ